MPDVARIRKLGRLGEVTAERFLAERGCTTVARNTTADGGEIDLIVSEGARLVAVEVKTVSDGSNPFDAVDDRKFTLVARTALGLDRPISRVDLVGISVDRHGVEIRWLRGPD